jgi:hypothetical protein
MANLQHPLRLDTVIWFWSLEFMSLGIEYDMVFLPPRHLADTQEQPELRPRPLRHRRQRRNNHNHITGSAPCPVDALGLANDIDSLARDLASVSPTLGASTPTRVDPTPTLLAPTL